MKLWALLACALTLSCNKNSSEKDQEIAALKAQLAQQDRGRSSIGSADKLAPDLARKLLIDKLWKDGKKNNRECWWNGLIHVADKVFAFDGVDENHVRCMTTFREEGLVEIGKCLKPMSNGCWHVRVDPKGKARMSNNTLIFPCGEVDLPEIKSVTTDGNRATVTYERDGKLDEALLGRLAACVIVRPEDARRMERSKKFQRDDTGIWQLNEEK